MKQNIDLTGIERFKSPLAPKLAVISALGFLGGLGFLPGCERLFGFTGFFGFFGTAFIAEIIHRLTHRAA